MQSDSADAHESPFAELNYPPGGCPPSTGDLGKLAGSIRELVGVDGLTALAAAILLDQGRAAEAFDRLTESTAERARVEEERRQRRAVPR